MQQPTHSSSTTTTPPPNLSSLAKLRWAITNPPSNPTTSFHGKTVLVTGANSGLGFEAAVKYAQKGVSRLFLGVRSFEKGEVAKREILKRSGRGDEGQGGEFIHVLVVDLSSFESVRRFVVELGEKVRGVGGEEEGGGGLHIALLNAGLANPRFEKSIHGYEMGLQVNVLSTAVMALGILPLLRRTATFSSAKEEGDAPHLTFVNSIAHADVKREWYAAGSDEVEGGKDEGEGGLFRFANDEDRFDARKSYAVVKLLGMAVMRHLARQGSLSSSSSTTTSSSPVPTSHPQVIINACCPFICRTSLGRNFSLPMRLVMGAMQRFTARSAEEGARTLVGATALGRESHGGFWTHDVLQLLGGVAGDEEEMERCWGEIERVLEREGVLGGLG